MGRHAAYKVHCFHFHSKTRCPRKYLIDTATARATAADTQLRTSVEAYALSNDARVVNTLSCAQLRRA